MKEFLTRSYWWAAVFCDVSKQINAKQSGDWRNELLPRRKLQIYFNFSRRLLFREIFFREMPEKPGHEAP